MILVYILSTIYWVLSPLNSALLVATNQSYFKFNEKTTTKNVQDARDYSNESRNASKLPTYDFCKEEEHLHEFITRDNKTQMMWITWNRSKAGERALLPNICSVDNGLPLHRYCRSFNGSVEWEKHNSHTVLIDCRVSMFCEAEPFDHYFLNWNGKREAHHNIWQRSRIGEYAGLKDLCLQPNGLHLTRKCDYDANTQRGRWMTVDHLKDVKCLQHVQQPVISAELNRLQQNLTSPNVLLSELATRRQACASLLSLLKKPQVKVLPADIQLISQTFQNILSNSQDSEMAKDVLEITHQLMATDPVVLRVSAELNATNTLLQTFENYMDGITNQLVPPSQCHVANSESTITLNGGNDTSFKVLNLTGIGVYAHTSPNISVFFVNPSCALITGIAIYGSHRPDKHTIQGRQAQQHMRYDSLSNVYYRFIFMNESIHDLVHEADLEMAAFIPADIWTSLQHSYRHSLAAVVFKIYAHDALFVEQQLLYTRKPCGKVFSITLLGLSELLPQPLPFILRNKKHTSRPHPHTGCGYWNYTTWSSSGVYTNSSAADDAILCFTNHLTQFTFLLGGTYRQSDLHDEVLVSAAHEKALNIITMIGCSLSLLGLAGIWITALLFRDWRSQASNKVLLNMCVALTLQMVLFLFVNTYDISEALVESHSYKKCVVLGALLQYSILVLFTWMLLVALLQFQRYVTVIGIQRPKHYILKSALLAWSAPLVPTLLVALLDAQSYIPTKYELVTDTAICYPSGKGLLFGVILPISVVVVVNLSIFLHVFYSISRTLGRSMQRYEKQLVVKQIRLSILLFFLLGLSWIFGLLAFVNAAIIFSYLFCLTSTLQGFVLFIYFVIVDENASNSWRNMLRTSRAKRKNGAKKPVELQSMTTASTSLGADNTPSGEH